MNVVPMFPSVDWTASFEEDCIAAIETYLARRRADAPQSLDYNGIALDTLAARYLYILLISNQSVQMHYATFKAGMDCDFPLADPHVRAVVSQMTARSVPNGVTSRSRFSEFAPLWRLVRRLKSFRLSSAANGGHGRPVLLMVHHRKFVRYFRPILDAMPGTSAFLLPDRRTQHALDIADSESLAQPLATPRVVTPAVREWRSLCVMVEVIRAALAQHKPRCVLVAEGDAPYHEAL